MAKMVMKPPKRRTQTTSAPDSIPWRFLKGESLVISEILKMIDATMAVCE